MLFKYISEGKNKTVGYAKLLTTIQQSKKQQIDLKLNKFVRETLCRWMSSDIAQKPFWMEHF